MRTTKIDELESRLYSLECVCKEVEMCSPVYDDVDFITMYDELKYELEQLVCF